MNIVTLSCGDEQLALETFNQLRQSPFKGNLLECSLDSVNLYISALDNVRNRKRSANYQPKYNYNPYNQFQQYYPYQYSNYNYGKYNYNPNYPGPGTNGYGGYSEDPNSHSKGGRKPYNKKGHYNNKYKNNQYNKEPKNFDDDKDFPPLPNEKKEGEN